MFLLHYSLFKPQSLYNHHEEAHGLPRPIKAKEIDGKKPTTKAINGSLKVYTILGTGDDDLFEFMIDEKAEFRSILLQNTVRYAQKVQFCATIELEKPVEDEDGMKIFVRSNMQPVYKEGLKDDFDMVEKMLSVLYTFTASGRGWILVKIVQLDVRLALFAPMTGSSYIALLNKLQSCNSLLNIRNHEDHNCFLYCFTAAWH